MPKKKLLKIEKETLSRPPIVTVMGHVDHGKTSLLDAIRKTNVADKEHGGITQHIGAYQVEVNLKEGNQKITFIDTPGHEAFNEMRSRGAQVTDLAIIVIDAKDGVMPQTIESISHCQKSQVPFLIALNKIDLPEANPERVKKQLAEKCQVLVEGFGGDVVCVPISAKTKKGIDVLLEMILLLAQLKGIIADPKGILDAVVIESKMDKGKGPVCSVITKNGTLKIGDSIFAEDIKGKVRALIDSNGKNQSAVFPGTPVEIIGFEKVPPVGAKIRNIFNPLDMPESKDLPQALEMKLPVEKPKKLNLILKVDVSGSLEAIEKSLSTDIEIISKGIGEINESDILNAKSNNAIVVGFNVKIPGHVKKLADNEKILVTTYQVIYLLLDELADAAVFIDKPLFTEKVLGEAKIIAIFPRGKQQIAGVKITKDRIAKNDTVRIIRGEDEIGKAKIISLHHLKTEINKAEVGSEAGIIFDSNIDFAVGDAIISYRKII